MGQPWARRISTLREGDLQHLSLAVGDVIKFWKVVCVCSTRTWRNLKKQHGFQKLQSSNYPVRTCAKGLSNWFCLSVSLSVCQSGEKILNLNIDSVKQFPNLTVALTL